ncbi:sigma-70 family RNA polymerase sigma factor [Paractinoplanes durhamensis]|uniref:RNA polymerase sigma factor n=1 Tax=Paractinoplanes durhamensis TaxID=113563 RepID=A0ABQ3Z3N1_9ACTN|nr:sigma-70 family RNA polymerase sigma factor [Actinoplanes durhamensis]GIE04432.1 RNA polymerase sigma factor [Actinoplanes durhamensis]
MTPPTDPLAALAFAAGRGDRDALTDLIRLTQRDVLRFLAPLTSPAEVEDLAQETYLRAVGALPRFAGRSTVRTWLFSIARRVAADHVRHATRRPRTAALPDWESNAEAVTATRGASRFEEHHALTELIRALAPDRREAFLLTQVAGLSYAEVAEICDCPVGTIRSRIARAREDLVTAMQSQESSRLSG